MQGTSLSGLDRAGRDRPVPTSLLASLAAIVWTVLWFGLYAIDQRDERSSGEGRDDGQVAGTRSPSRRRRSPSTGVPSVMAATARRSLREEHHVVVIVVLLLLLLVMLLLRLFGGGGGGGGWGRGPIGPDGPDDGLAAVPERERADVQ
jgi:hypothetical protein